MDTVTGPQVLAAIKLAEKLNNFSEVERRTGIGRRTVSGWLDKKQAGKVQVVEGGVLVGTTLFENPGTETPTPETPAKESPEVLAMENAALKAELKDAKADRTDVQNLSPIAEPIETESLWNLAEEENNRWIERAKLRSHFTWKLNVDHPIAIAFSSDQHIAPRNTIDLKRMREDAELIRDTPHLYAILGGDGVDNHIKHSTAILAARSQPDEQWKLYNYYLQVLAPKIGVVISGNHDHWTNQVSGIDMVKQLCDKNKLQYAPHEARVKVQLPGVEYDVAVRHQYRFNSGMNLCHTVKQWYRFGEQPFDIGVICHHHEAAVESFRAHGKERWAARPGSYQVSSDYMLQYGFPRAVPTCPTFVIYPHERQIIGFSNVHTAVKLLQAELGQ